ncbi:MAG: BadF/BadG/BcrA/BcrD ATPase family protein [Candidatus Neomarinimicrobiota bacterium]
MIILSIDGGASRTRGVLFTEGGEVRLMLETEATSLSRADADTPRLLSSFIEELASQAGLALEQIELVNVGVAGVSGEEPRERLFKELDRLGVADRAIITSDVESAYEAFWGEAPGVLVCVGTGAIGWARDADGSTHRASGRGPQLGGDPGSGFWLGKQAMVRLITSEGSQDPQLEDFAQRIAAAANAETLEEAARFIGEAPDMIAATASLGGPVCELAEEANDVALAILQEGTQHLGDELLALVDAAGLREDSMGIGMNGGIIAHNPIFRKLLAEAMSYNIPRIEWLPMELDPVFGAGLIAARLNGIVVDLDALKQNWSRHHLQSAG